MLTQLLASLVVGALVSTVLFAPIVVWQFRRYGRFDAARIAWTIIGFMYATGVVAFTIFPLPEFTPDFCAARTTGPVLDLLRVPREFAEIAGAHGLGAAVRDWVVWETALNLLLFVPFGFLARRVLEWRPLAVLVAALGLSLFIEATQLTANWGLMPCAYRVADVTDLVTNTTGAAIGLGVAALSPRLLASTADLVAQRHAPRPVTRIRRLLGMLVDVWFLGLATVVGAATGMIAWFVIAGPFDPSAGHVGTDLMTWLMTAGATIASMVAIIGPALVGSGASLGQRAVYLAPVPRDGLRWRMLVRAMVVQGAATLLPLLGLFGALLGAFPLVALAVVVVLVDPRGLSYLVAGCGIRDARDGASIAAGQTFMRAPVGS